MINEDIWDELQETTVFPDVILMDEATFKRSHYEMIRRLCTPELAEMMLRQLPEDVVLYGVPVVVTNDVKGFELI